MNEFLQFYFKAKKGFTLVELLVVIAVISILTALGLSSFGTYSSSQTFGTGVSEFTNFLSITRSKSISQVKPAACGSGDTLEGYKVVITPSGSDYTQEVACGGRSIVISSKKLPNQVTFVSGSSADVLYDVSSGTVLSPGSIGIRGFGKTVTINFDKIGNISIN